MDKLQRLVLAITEYYQGAPTAPSVVTSWLSRDAVSEDFMRSYSNEWHWMLAARRQPLLNFSEPLGLYYGSIVTYEGKYGQGKELVVKSVKPTLDEVYDDLADQFLHLTGNGPQMHSLKSRNAA